MSTSTSVIVSVIALAAACFEVGVEVDTGAPACSPFKKLTKESGKNL